MTFLDWKAFQRFIREAVQHYAKTAPAVASFLDEEIYLSAQETPESVSLYALTQVQMLWGDAGWEDPSHAANRIYKLKDSLGQNTVGLLDH